MTNLFHQVLISAIVKQKFFVKVLAIITVLSLLSLSGPGKLAFAQTFNPTATLSSSSITLGANPDLIVSASQPSGDDLIRGATFHIPAGFDIAAGSSLAPNEVVGLGQFSEFNLNINNVFSGNLVFRNDLTIRPGDKAHWLLDFTDPGSGFVYITLNVYVSGDISSGHTVQIVRNVDLPHITTPAQFDFTFFGKTAANKPVFTNPSLAGGYGFQIVLTSETGLQLTKSATANLPAITPSGTGVTNQFNGGISVNFNRVVGAGGQTTISSSSTPPQAGTGQFQLGGPYYDFNTTANVKCPCTVTMPYDPAITPSPRIYHLESGVWTDVTTAVDGVNHTVTGVVSSFSFFAVGAADFSVSWDKKIEKFLEKEGSPFDIKEDKKLKIEFNLLDSSDQPVTPENVTVEIWQVLDAAGSPVDPAKVLTLTPDLKEKKDEYKAKLGLKKTPLDLGTYEIRVVVDNTTASQTPQTASFTVVEKH